MFRREPRATSSLESEAIEQIMERLPHGVRRLAAQLRTPLGIEELWAVLTDYENLSTFIPNLSSSQLVHREGTRFGCSKWEANNCWDFDSRRRCN